LNDEELKNLIALQTKLLATQTAQLTTRDDNIAKLTDKIGELISHIPNNNINQNRKINKTNDNIESKKSKTGSDKKKKDMPIQYSDGTFTENFREKEGFFKYNFRLNGEYECTYGYSEQECFDKRTEKLRGTYKSRKMNNDCYTVAGWARQYFELFRRSKCAPEEHATYERYIKHIEEYFAKTTLKKVTGEQIQEFINQFSDKSRKAKRITHFLKAAFLKAFGLGHIKINPCVAIDTPQHTSKHFPVFTFAQQRLILESITLPKYKEFFMFCCCTGLRVGEAVNAIPNIDFENNLVCVTDEDTKQKNIKERFPSCLMRLINLY